MKRGEYRAVHTVIVDGPDYQDLTPPAKLCFWTLKMMLGASGIDAVAALEAVLSERTGHTLEAVQDALAELAAGGWIERERNVVWLVDGLRYEPSIVATNVNHRKGIQDHVAGLPRLAIVARFCERYADWFHDAEPLDMPSETPSKGIRKASEGDTPTHAKGMGKQEIGDRREEEGERIEEKGILPFVSAPVEPEGFAEAWALYPRRSGGNPRKPALDAYSARLKEGVAPAELIEATRRYAAHIHETGRLGTPYVMQARTFYGPNGRWCDDYGRDGDGAEGIPAPVVMALRSHWAANVGAVSQGDFERALALIWPHYGSSDPDEARVARWREAMSAYRLWAKTLGGFEESNVGIERFVKMARKWWDAGGMPADRFSSWLDREKASIRRSA